MKLNNYSFMLLVIFSALAYTYYINGALNWLIVLIAIILGLLASYIMSEHEKNNNVLMILYIIILITLVLCVFTKDIFGSIISLMLLLGLLYYDSSNFLYNLANLFYNRANNISLMFCNLAIKFDVNQSDIFKLKGDILLEKKDYEGAFECYKRVLYFENDSNTINDIAVSLEYMGKYDEALNYYDDSLNINPNNVLTLNNKAILLIKLKRYNEALSLLNEVLCIDENNITAMENREKIINKIK